MLLAASPPSCGGSREDRLHACLPACPQGFVGMLAAPAETHLPRCSSPPLTPAPLASDESSSHAGMMIIVGRLKDTGVFELMSAWVVTLSKGRMWLLSTLLM